MADDNSTASSSSVQIAGPSNTSTSNDNRPQSMQNVYRRRSAFSFPRAAQPEIVRAYQKDVYYRDLLQTQLQDVVRSLLGSRVLFQNADSISFVGSVAYFALSTLGGAQTLGEEYVNAMMTDGKTGRIVALKRRMSFIFFYVIAPFLSTRLYSMARRKLVSSHQLRSQALQRAQLRAAAVAPKRGPEAERAKENAPKATRVDRIVAVLAERLPTMDSIHSSTGILAYFGAAHLALFYLGGRYYKFSQRLSGTEYISTIPRRPGSKPPSYEVLGFLLGVQLFIKLVSQANRWRISWQQKKKADVIDEEGETESEQTSAVSVKETVQIDDSQWSHKTSPPSRVQKQQKKKSEEVPLQYPDADGLPSAQDLGLEANVDRSQLEAARASAKVKAAELEAIGQSVLRCTLCMEQREPEKGTSAVTECGHVFCWDCILGWSKEKAECPLCRQSFNPSHLLPIYNF
ncbi:uncharacterized protein FA14DRAFT_16737 [Meira miltonrushii]|uniref:RING-type E3 ubiquitin transferase n=1 Tax=Meira miltonrushii TaxID=1280837 RepID=A0A316VIW2_9BASI|nr:uncharacterized protein FA14DRAFT_16737 [Meira miltonrushii]PWN37607.1 hypothetical protein FA14DRAFT_16737 [Meira miltonrushii]